MNEKSKVVKNMILSNNKNIFFGLKLLPLLPYQDIYDIFYNISQSKSKRKCVLKYRKTQSSRRHTHILRIKSTLHYITLEFTKAGLNSEIIDGIPKITLSGKNDKNKDMKIQLLKLYIEETLKFANDDPS